MLLYVLKDMTNSRKTEQMLKTIILIKVSLYEIPRFGLRVFLVMMCEKTRTLSNLEPVSTVTRNNAVGFILPSI
jgi:hypothetical protein